MVQVPDALKDVTAGGRILSAIKDNQLLTAAVMFILWQMDLFNSVLDMDVEYNGNEIW